MNGTMSAFSLVLDQQSPVARFPELITSAKAHIVLQIILSGGLVLSDTQCLVAPNVGRMLYVDGLVRELVRQKRVQVALRDFHPNGSAVNSLSGLVGIHRDTVKNAAELARFVDEAAAVLRWSTEAVSKAYTVGTENLLMRRLLAEEPRLASLTPDFIEGVRLRNNGKLNRINIEVDYIAHIRGYNIQLSVETIQRIRDYSAAFYFGSIPDVLNLEALYNESHQRPIEYKLDATVDTAPSGGEFTESALDLTKLVEGLANLPIDDVIRLADSPEAQGYRRMVKKAIIEPNDHNLSEIVYSLQLLSYRIDEAILASAPGWRVPKASRSGRRWRKQVGYLGLGLSGATETASSVASLIFGWSVPMIGLLVGGFTAFISGRLIDEPKIAAEEYAEHQTRMTLLRNSYANEGKAAELSVRPPVKLAPQKTGFITSWKPGQ